MSMENAKNFYEKVIADKDLQQKIGELAKKKPEKMGEIILKTAKENGFEFNEAEMKACIAEKVKANNSGQELIESELEAVAGGDEDKPWHSHMTSRGLWCDDTSYEMRSRSDCHS